MISTYFFPLACLVTLIVFVIIVLRVGLRTGQRTSFLALGGACLSTLALVVGSWLVLGEHFQSAQISQASTFGGLTDEDLVSSWMSSHNANALPQVELTRELRSRMDRGDLAINARKAVIERATQLVLEDPDGAGLDWVWHVRRWALTGALPDEQAELVMGRLLQSLFFVAVDVSRGGYTSARISSPDSAVLGIAMRDLQLPNESLSINVEVYGLLVDGEFHHDVGNAGKGTSSSGRPGYYATVTREHGLIRNLNDPDSVSQAEELVARCLATIELSSGEGDKSAPLNVHFDAITQPLLTSPLYPKNSALIGPHQVVDGPLAASLVRAVLMFNVSAQCEKSGYRLIVTTGQFGYGAKTYGPLPFCLSFDVDTDLPSCGEKSSPGLIQAASLDQITPSVRTALVRGHSNNHFSWHKKCVGDIPDTIDIYLKYIAPTSWPRGMFVEPNPVFFGGELVIEDVPVRVIQDPSETSP